MRLLFLSSIFPDSQFPTRGTFNAALCRELAGEHDLRIVAPRIPQEKFPPPRFHREFLPPRDLAERNIPVEYPTAWLTPGFWHHRYGEQMWWSLRRGLSRTMREFRPDAVLSYWAHPEGEVAARAAAITGVPSAVIVGGTDVLALPKCPRRGPAVRRALDSVSAVITVSDQLRHAVVNLGIAPERVHTIYQGINPEQFHHHRTRVEARVALGLDSEVAHLVWVGRMEPVKGLDLLIHSAEQLHRRGTIFQLHLLGDGHERPRLESLVTQLGLTGCVQFHGSRPQSQLPDWYRAADVTLLSSLSEGLPNVLRESLACGTPFVATDVGGIREIAIPEASVLVSGRDPSDFANAIQNMLHPECREAAALYAPRTWRESARDVAGLLNSLRGEKPLGATPPLRTILTPRPASAGAP